MASSTTFDPSPGGPKINPDLPDLANQLHDEFANRLAPREVDECLDRMSAKFNNARVRSFVSLLVRRCVRDELNDRLAGA